MNIDRPALSAQNPRVKQLRLLARDPHARDREGFAVIDAPRAIVGAIERGAPVVDVFVDSTLPSAAAAEVAESARAAGICVTLLDTGVADRIADARSSAGALATVRTERLGLAALATGDCWLVVVRVNDPGNLGTLLRSAEAAGASGIVVGTGSVDSYNPKVLRASAGARFGIPVVEADVVTALETLAARGVRRIGASAGAGDAYDRAELPASFAFVLGHETAGFADAPIDTWVHVPMAGDTESLNLAMAGTVLLFDAARRRTEVQS